MNPQASPSKPGTGENVYTAVLDGRKQQIRGLCQRNGRFYARITVEAADGRKRVKRFPLAADTPAQARAELEQLKVSRSKNQLWSGGHVPKLDDYAEIYLTRLATSGKKSDTVITEKTHVHRWRQALGHLRLDKLRAKHINTELHRLKRDGLSSRTCNLARVVLRNLLREAIKDEHLSALPDGNIDWLPVQTAERRLITSVEFDRLVAAAPGATKNATQFCDYLRFLQYSGAREQESLLTRWCDVDFGQGRVTIGASGDTKNRQPRSVDLNAELHALLLDMHRRRQPDSEWLFPSPQRGDRDIPARTFRESLKQVRAAAGLPGVGFHDFRHYFISHAVMSGIDFMTIARWVGHKDGGVLIGKTYGHIADAHRQAMAAKLRFQPAAIPAVASGPAAKPLRTP